MALKARHSMTSRQAKKAYSKLNGPKLTEVELRHLRRDAVLYERKMKAEQKEKARLANKQKRLEREEKFKEQRRKNGNADEGYVSPRQVRLAAYFGKLEDQVEDDAAMEKNDCTIQDDYVPLRKNNVDMAKDVVMRTTVQSPIDCRPLDGLMVDEDWATLLPTNTQVVRELDDDYDYESVSSSIVGRVRPALKPPRTAGACLPETALDVPKEDTNRRKDFPIPMPPLSTQDLEFSPEDLAELTSPVKVCQSLSKLACLSSKNDTRTTRPSMDTTKEVTDSKEYGYGTDDESTKKSVKLPTLPTDYGTVSCNSSSEIGRLELVPSNSPQSITPKPNFQKSDTLSASRSYVLGDRQVIPGHSKNFVQIPTPTRKPPMKKTFGGSVAQAMRPPNRKVLGELNNVSKMPGRTKRNGTPRDASCNSKRRTATSQKMETAAATFFEFGDSFSSTQDLLDYKI
ncbi:hypothetical protein MMC13_004970 [Lambiella insularis]|nr:hypothetical protein [Lambiella insularis]